jgi:hypothetical protein
VHYLDAVFAFRRFNHTARIHCPAGARVLSVQGNNTPRVATKPYRGLNPTAPALILPVSEVQIFEASISENCGCVSPGGLSAIRNSSVLLRTLKVRLASASIKFNWS